MLNKKGNIKRQNIIIERVRVTKALGMFIDELLNCKIHINMHNQSFQNVPL